MRTRTRAPQNMLPLRQTDLASATVALAAFAHLESLLSSEVAAVLEHVATQVVQRPERALSRFVGRSG